ncbi:MAG: 2-oxo acid dehydrogenase subunit E2 [Planctomycetes bacterium]|nr:2-oxo acid dehydrogenase subunit E2 [Planctomycetota bacterium]
MDFQLPELGEGVYEAEAVRWLVKAGDTVKPGQALLEVLTDKATMEVPAPFAGVIENLLVKPGDRIEIGQAILQHDGKPGAQPKSAANPDHAKADSPKPQGGKSENANRPGSNGPPPAPGTSTLKAAPAVRQMARKLGIDLAQVRGSGPAGRIMIDDLAASAAPVAHAPGSPKPLSIDFGQPGTRIPFTGLRRVIAEHMVHAKTTIPHYAYVDECDVTDLVTLRESLKEPGAAKGIKLTYLAFFVKAAAFALKEVPIVNATLDEKAGEIVMHDRYDIGIAVATPGGLIVPVVRDADKKSLLEVAGDIERLSSDARHGKQRREDLQGATFSVTSVGNIGGLFSTPIIAHPQVAILGLGKIVKRPVFDENGQVKAADMVYLSFSFDHRVLDGAVGAAFGNAVIARLKSPAVLLL